MQMLMPYLDRPGVQQWSLFLITSRTRVIWFWGNVGVIHHMEKKRSGEKRTFTHKL